MSTQDPIVAEVIIGGLEYASEEMGIAVRNAAYSPNIKERLDHSCALFDEAGRLIAQAEHIPVHLGSLPWGLRRTLAAIAERGEAMAPGDHWVVNDPYLSGTHLNDVTVIRPIFVRGALFGYAANKAHHADVGGAVPGSMPPDARDLFAEGFVAPPLRLVREDRVCDDVLALFAANSRTPASRLGDLRAQIAGNVTGERRLLELVKRYGPDVVRAASAKSLADSERRMCAALRAFPDGTVEVRDALEDAAGEPSIVLALRLEKRGEAIALDYRGTSPQVSLPLNAVLGVTLSGVFYALRAAIGPDIAANDGAFAPVRVDVPEGTLLNPRRPAAVGGGNVETSMRNADLVLAALGALAPGRIGAQSGGSMNNVMIGGIDARGRAWSFYETNGCGMGARPDQDGLDGIHAHMTNTLNTPIEVIERMFPLRVTRYEFAEGSAGSGRRRGGMGLVRALELTEGEATVSLLAERHRLQPKGAAGGGDGACGYHQRVAHDGTHERIRAKTTIVLGAGEGVVVATAGGGGYGVAVPEAFATERLRCTRVAREDYEDLCRLESSEAVQAPIFGVRTRAETAERLERSLETWRINGFGKWIVRLPDGTFVGVVLLVPSRIADEAGIELGYALMPEFWNRGYASELAAAALAIARDIRGAPRVVAVTGVDNASSRRVLAKTGLRFVREFEHHGPAVLYALDRATG